MNGESGWVLSWLGLAIAVVVLSEYPSAGPAVRYTLLAIIAYVLLTNARVFGPPIQRWVARLSSAGPHTTAFDQAHRPGAAA